ncbi:uncharacterized protein LOC111861451 isoform X2 [Cryptotermes secundus]|nr:uncharacterized protein LOC111861451 isoform X2 [Cryptotermes secundus]
MDRAMDDVESYCSSDDEVLYGPITKKEIKKTLELRRQTKIHRPVSEYVTQFMCGDGTPGSTSAGKEETRRSLTVTLQRPRCKENLTEMWKHRSIEILLDCDENDDSGEAETLAPPPSPDLRYSGSPYPTPSHPHQRLCSSLRGIAEEEGCGGGVKMQSTPVHLSFLPKYSDAEQFGEWSDRHALSYSSVASDESLSVLSKLNDDLLDDMSRLSLVPVMSRKETLKTSTFSGEMPQVSDEDTKIRGILIEKMEQHVAQTQRLRATKKQTTSVLEDCKKPLTFEAEIDDIIILNDVQNDFSLNEDIPTNQEAEILNDDNLEVTSSGSESSVANYQALKPDTPATGDKSEGYRFSRLIPEREFASLVRDHDDILCQSIFLGDPEFRNDRQEVDEAITAVESQTSKVSIAHDHELNDASFTAPARPPSPEFDIEMPEHKALLPSSSSHSYVAAEYSLISEADDCLERSAADDGEMEACDRNCAAVGADEDGGFLSVLSEAALYHASLKHTAGHSVGLTESTAMCSECTQDVLRCACAAPAVLSISKECDGVEVHLEPLPLPEASGESREERRGQEECPGRDVSKMGTDDGNGSSVSVSQEGSVLNSSLCSHVGSCGREMDASSDLNDSDRRNIGDTKNLESHSDEEGFHDTLEEMELLLKFGMEYMMSSNDGEYLSMTGNQSLSHSVSTPKKPLGEMLELEDFGDAIDQVESYYSPADCIGTSCKDCSVAAEACVSTVSDQNSVKTVSASETGENVFLKPPTTPLRKPHYKLQAVVSPTLKSNKPSPFKIPVKPVLHSTPVQKLLPPRSTKKSPLKPVMTMSPCRRPVNYNKIVSPVGAYIHNTPSPSLLATVKPKPLHTVTAKGTLVGRGAAAIERQDPLSGIQKTSLEVPRKLDSKGRENVDTSNIRPVLPLVSYESVPSVKLEEPQQERMPRLNEKMKRLVDTPKPHVFRHEGRVKVTASPRTPNVKVTGTKKRVTDFDSSCVASSDADGEISVVVSKQVTRTNTLGV